MNAIRTFVATAQVISAPGFLDKPREPAFKLIVIKSYTLEAEVRFLKLLSARLVFI